MEGEGGEVRVDDRVEEVVSVGSGEPVGRGGEGDDAVEEVGRGFSDHFKAGGGVGCELGGWLAGEKEREERERTVIAPGGESFPSRYLRIAPVSPIRVSFPPRAPCPNVSTGRAPNG